MMARALPILICIVVFSVSALADKKFVITSEPSGAKVDFAGKDLGTTPIESKLDDYFFKGPRYLWSDYLRSPISITVSKEGYVAKTLVITSGPFRWVNLNNTAEKIYYQINSTSFHIKLEPIGSFLGTNPTTPVMLASPPAELNPNSTRYSVEEIARDSLPSVVTVRTDTGSGTGFFITESGIVVTNKHVVGDSQRISIVDAKGQVFVSSSIFIHPSNDLALIKIKGSGFPYLRLAQPESVNVGSDVVAIGSPGLPGYSEILPNTVTKGIVSSFRKEELYGVLIQTDAAINKGNSGGPLLNLSGEVVGVNTLGYRYGGATGINFAILSSEVLKMLKEHFAYVPSYPSLPKTENTTKAKESQVTLNITSEPAGAEIFVDDAFVGSTPSKIEVPAGERVIRVKRPEFTPWERKLVLEAGASRTINAILEKAIAKP